MLLEAILASYRLFRTVQNCASFVRVGRSKPCKFDYSARRASLSQCGTHRVEKVKDHHRSHGDRRNDCSLSQVVVAPHAFHQ